MWNRRQVLAALGAFAAVPAFGFAASGPDRRRFVLVLLRGGLDGLAAVPPTGDAGFAGLREPGVPLDADFGLHEALAPLLPWWTSGELAVVHALGSPYGGRSHFDAMDVLENGTATPGRPDGWLNRALATRQGPDPIALGPSLPLVLRGAAEAGNVSGAGVPRDDRFLDAVLALYEGDPELGPVLREGLELREMVSDVGPTRRPGAELAAKVLADPDGPDVAVLQIGGFDTHARQGPALEARLGDLARQALTLREGLGAAWDRTVVCVVSEFGRTVAVNGTDGTDHGRAGVALVFGGPVAGGRVLGPWPGLSHLYEGRDLAPTTDTRALFKALLAGHLGIDEGALEDAVFPDSRDIVALDGVLR